MKTVLLSASFIILLLAYFLPVAMSLFRVPQLSLALDEARAVEKLVKRQKVMEETIETLQSDVGVSTVRVLGTETQQFALQSSVSGLDSRLSGNITTLQSQSTLATNRMNALEDDQMAYADDLAALTATVSDHSQAIPLLESQTAELDATTTATDTFVQTLDNRLGVNETLAAQHTVTLANHSTSFVNQLGLITTLQSEVTEVDSRLSSAVELLQTGAVLATTRLDGQEVILDSHTSELTDLTTTVTGHTESLSDLELSLSTLATSTDTSVISLESAVNTLTTQQGIHQASLSSQAVSLANLQSQTSLLAADHGTLEGTVATLEGNVSDITNQLSAVETTVEGHTTSIAGHLALLTELTALADGMDQSIGNINTTLTTMNQSIGNINTTLTTAVEDISIIEDDVANLALADTALEARVAAAETAIVELDGTSDGILVTQGDHEDRIVNAETSISSISTDLTNVTSTVNTLGTNLTSVTNSVNSIDTQVGDLLTRIGGVELTLPGLDQTLAVDLLNLAVADLETGQNAQDSRLTDLETDMGTTTAALTTHQSTLDDLQVDISTLNTTVSALPGLDTRLSAVENEVSLAELSITELETEQVALGGRVTTVESDLTTLTSTVSSQSTALTTLDGRCTTLESDVATLQASGGGGGGGSSFEAPDPTQLLYVYHEGYNREINGPVDAALPPAQSYDLSNTLPCTALFPSSTWVDTGHLNASKEFIGKGLYCATASFHLTGMASPASLTTFQHRFRLTSPGVTLTTAYMGPAYRAADTTQKEYCVTIGPFYFQIAENQGAELVIDSIAKFTTAGLSATILASRICITQLSIAGFYPATIPAGLGPLTLLPTLPTYTNQGSLIFPASFTGMYTTMAGLFVHDTTITLNSGMSGVAWRDVPNGYEVKVSSYITNPAGSVIWGVYELFDNSSATCWNPGGPYGNRPYYDEGVEKVCYLQEPYSSNGSVYQGGGGPGQYQSTPYSGGTADGEFVQWKFPFYAAFTTLGIKARDAALTRAPKNCSVLGSNDEVTWSLLGTLAYTGFGTNAWQSKSLTPGTFHRYIRVVFHSTQGAQVLNPSQLQLTFDAYTQD
jgi:hypothetical protein